MRADTIENLRTDHLLSEGKNRLWPNGRRTENSQSDQEVGVVGHNQSVEGVISHSFLFLVRPPDILTREEPRHLLGCSGGAQHRVQTGDPDVYVWERGRVVPKDILQIYGMDEETRPLRKKTRSMAARHPPRCDI